VVKQSGAEVLKVKDKALQLREEFRRFLSVEWFAVAIYIKYMPRAKNKYGDPA
jgi:hypothetical protein